MNSGSIALFLFFSSFSLIFSPLATEYSQVTLRSPVPLKLPFLLVQGLWVLLFFPPFPWKPLILFSLFSRLLRSTAHAGQEGGDLRALLREKLSLPSGQTFFSRRGQLELPPFLLFQKSPFFLPERLVERWLFSPFSGSFFPYSYYFQF